MIIPETFGNNIFQVLNSTKNKKDFNLGFLAAVTRKWEIAGGVLSTLLSRPMLIKILRRCLYDSRNL
jgi:hypothetical protein